MIKNTSVFILCLVAIVGCHKPKEEKVKDNVEVLNVNAEKNKNDVIVLGTNNAIGIGKNSSATTKNTTSGNTVITNENDDNIHIMVNGRNNAIAVGENSTAKTQ